MGLFGGIQDAKYSEGGVYLTPGVYRLEIQAIKKIKARTGKAGFVAEFKILEASGETKLKPGNTASWMTMEGDNFLGNVKNFAAVASACYQDTDQVDDSSVTEEALEAITAETGEGANPLKGVCMRASAVNVKTKRGTDFTKIKWLPDVTTTADVESAHATNR